MALGPNFESVLQAARVGAEWAWTQIYRDLAPAVLRYLTMQGAPDSEDVLGEVFVRIVRALPEFEGDEKDFRAWTFKLAHNAMVDAWRRAGRRPVDFLPDELLEEARTGDSAEAEVVRHEAYERVKAVLAKLTQDQREVVFLRIIVGLSIDEAAQVLGKSPGSVKSLQVRAIASIRREISAEPVS